MTTKSTNWLANGTAEPFEPLALYGGPRTVTKRFKERWCQVRWSALARILRFAWRDVNTSGGGPGTPLEELENRFIALTRARYALTVNSGTAALHSAFFAAGVKPGTEVIVPSYTFHASATPILQCGGTPIFCDVDPRTLTADPDDVEKRITPRTKAICVVHLWGNPAAMDRFEEIAHRHKVVLIEDCSHAPGAVYQGRPVGSWGDVGCFSLQGVKAVSGGELGIVVTSNPTLHDHMLALAHFGRTQRDQQAKTFDIGPFCFGLKYRPHLYGVLLALGCLDRLDELNRLRRRNYEILSEELRDCPGVTVIESYPDAIRGGLLEFVFHFHPEHAGGWNRGAFIQAVRAEGVPIEVERYTRMGLLHSSALFTKTDFSTLGGAMSLIQRAAPVTDEDLPGSAKLPEELVTLPPFTTAGEDFVRQCGRAMRKVARYAAAVEDHRTGALRATAHSNAREPMAVGGRA